MKTGKRTVIAIKNPSPGQARYTTLRSAMDRQARGLGRLVGGMFEVSPSARAIFRGARLEPWQIGYDNDVLTQRATLDQIAGLPVLNDPIILFKAHSGSRGRVTSPRLRPGRVLVQDGVVVSSAAA